MLYNHALPASHGLDVTFDQWQYGSTTPATPADGISFFLADGDTELNHPGAFGGSLGYAQKLPDDDPSADFLPGVDRGYLGVGLDVLGNYFGDWEHRGNGCANRSPAGTEFRVPAPGQNMVTLRGPGNGIEGYCFLAATTSNTGTTPPWPSTLPGQLHGPLTTLPPDASPVEAENALEPSRRRVHVRITPAPDPTVTVSVDFNDGAGFQQVLSAPAPQPVPDTYKFGFAGSTGLFTDVHLIRNVSIATDRPLPQLDLVKQVRRPLPGDLVEGSSVPYDFVVTNSGGTDLTDLRVDDPKVGPVSCPRSTLAPGEHMTCTATYTVTAEDVARGSIDNTATASGRSDDETVNSPPSSESVPIQKPAGIAVEKKVSPPGPYSVGQTVTYTYHVRNTGGSALTGVGVEDNRVSSVTCASTELAPQGQPGDSTTCTGQYTITEADGRAGYVTNVATAAGDADGRRVTSPETQQTLPVGAPHLTLHKRALSKGPFTVGDKVRYTYRVRNTGSTPLHDVLVSDDRVAHVRCDETTLDPGASTECRGTYRITRADLDACKYDGSGKHDWADEHDRSGKHGGSGKRCKVTNMARAGGTDPHGHQVTSELATATVTAIHKHHHCKPGHGSSKHHCPCKKPWPNATPPKGGTPHGRH